MSLYKAEISKENLLTGIHEYLPVIFDEDHFNFASVSLHSCIIDFCHSNDQTISTANEKQEANLESFNLSNSMLMMHEEKLSKKLEISDHYKIILTPTSKSS